MAGKKGMQGGGRHDKFGEETTTITVRVPLSKKAEIKAKIEKLLQRYTKNFKKDKLNETDYLTSTEANKKRLDDALEAFKRGEGRKINPEDI